MILLDAENNLAAQVLTTPTPPFQTAADAALKQGERESPAPTVIVWTVGFLLTPAIL
jgi:hypothetical protein